MQAILIICTVSPPIRFSCQKAINKERGTCHVWASREHLNRCADWRTYVHTIKTWGGCFGLCLFGWLVFYLCRENMVLFCKLEINLKWGRRKGEEGTRNWQWVSDPTPPSSPHKGHANWGAALAQQPPYGIVREVVDILTNCWLGLTNAHGMSDSPSNG